ncbi:MAG: hypothetical protein HY290_20435, partial [Planctomycetia bacterium]|nr:hypothetical protein [Planctomycetia bacterium]
MAGPFDLIVRAGRVVCPATGWDAPADVAIRGDRIAEVAPVVTSDVRRILEFPDGICLPGLIDLHAHPARLGSIYGVDPDRHVLPRGTTTVMSQGDAGAANCDAFVRDTIESSQTRVVLAINLSSRGEAGSGSCFERLELADVDACVKAVERHRAHIWGIAVNASQNCCGSTDPREIVRRGLLAAEQTGLP